MRCCDGRALGPTLEPVHESPQWLVIALNTTRPWRHKHGELSAEQVQRVAQRLRRATTAQLRVVVVHQPIAMIRDEDRIDGLARRMWVVQAGTALSSRVRPEAPNSVNLIRWGEGLPAGRCVVERWDYAVGVGGFAKVSEVEVPTERRSG
jgi:hypothetical protein